MIFVQVGFVDNAHTPNKLTLKATAKARATGHLHFDMSFFEGESTVYVLIALQRCEARHFIDEYRRVERDDCYFSDGLLSSARSFCGIFFCSFSDVAFPCSFVMRDQAELCA